jgi:hypothetical protein
MIGIQFESCKELPRSPAEKYRLIQSARQRGKTDGIAHLTLLVILAADFRTNNPEKSAADPLLFALSDVAEWG